MQFAAAKRPERNLQPVLFLAAGSSLCAGNHLGLRHAYIKASPGIILDAMALVVEALEAAGGLDQHCAAEVVAWHRLGLLAGCFRAASQS